MSRRQVVIALVGLGLVVVAAELLIETPRRAGASSLSYGPSGWLAARRYLEHRNVETSLLDEPLHQLEQDGEMPGEVLVLTFPSLRVPWPQEREALNRHLNRGGTVLFAFSGSRRSAGEERVADWLGLDWQSLRPAPPLSPIAWRRFANEVWRLRAAEAGGRLEGIEIRAFDVLPVAPGSAEVLLYGERDLAFVYRFPRGGGQVIVLPAEIFANARIANAAHANLLETLVTMTGNHWGFHEALHGLSAPRVGSDQLPGFAFDLFLLQVALVYGLGVFRLARRFGPAWKQEPLVSGSTKSFLLGLGRLHHRLQHHRDAASLLIERARELQPHLSLRPEDIRNQTGSGGEGLLSLAQTVAAAQSRPRSPS